MDGKCFTRMLQATMFTLALVAVLQELEKPREERKWHGKVAGIVPYDFRIPTMERLKESCWNPYESRIFTPRPCGIGWAINFYALLENLGFIKRADVSEESFLMPGKHIKEVLTQAPEEE